MTDQADVRQIWQTADAVCFDVDSTVITEEGLDELANYCGVGDKVAQLTKEAMGNGMSFREALTLRLDLFKPSLQVVEKFVQEHPPQLTPGVKEVVSLLQKRGTAVYLVSGGFFRIIEPIAKLVGVPVENIFANKLLFNEKGEYEMFDKDQPTVSSGGKARVVQLLKDTHGYKRVVVVGDGLTDAEACPPAEAFIGFGGNVLRPSVQEKAKWFVTSFTELAEPLKS
ncbi:LOW QUALITY PROTEIN: phosphoserine phosphatase-like [Branchiostoma floridae]|uniref:Phosphoserine phosphatase n=1 Tax=Branchiostoma floridae TaxID=7739 RepID=A0A9J7LYH8_BRAFL|nr:LOW QUALITY PROTEIN: phosphoserine phosphatase-like [Branchiostoma floridae]